METVGVKAKLTGGDVNLELPRPKSTVPCFEAPAGGEVVVGGRKLIGSAMRAHGRAILQHGAILLDWDNRLQAGSMGLVDDASLRPHVTTLRDQLGQVPPRSDLDEILVDAFSEGLAVGIEPGQSSEFEGAREDDLVASVVVAG